MKMEKQTVLELQKIKHETESKITDALLPIMKEFRDKTDLEIRSIGFITERITMMMPPQIVRLYIDIEL